MRVIGSLTWYNWWNATRNGDQSSARTIKLGRLNEDHSAVVLTCGTPGSPAPQWNNRYSPLTASEAEALTELLEAALERFDLE